MIHLPWMVSISIRAIAYDLFSTVYSLKIEDWGMIGLQDFHMRLHGVTITPDIRLRLFWILQRDERDLTSIAV